MKARFWTNGVPVEQEALAQIEKLCKHPAIQDPIAIMPDVHCGIGCMVGSVVPTYRAVIPSAVGVDIGCGMMAVKTSLTANDLPDSLKTLREKIEEVVPVGKNSFHELNNIHRRVWSALAVGFRKLERKWPKVTERTKPAFQLGTLGGGNHFIEICLDGEQNVWIMLHSGSRGVGNQFGHHFIELAKNDMREHLASLPDRDLAYFNEGTEHFQDYIEAVTWAQDYARVNREVMLELILDVMKKEFHDFRTLDTAVNCHHNYVSLERHGDRDLYITRKGAVSAKEGELGIIPGSMGAKSYIVRGLGNSSAYNSCSHGAGRVMSRSRAKQSFTLEDHEAATRGVECRKDVGVLDETPGCYKPIDDVMAAQADLVEPINVLRQVICIKG